MSDPSSPAKAVAAPSISDPDIEILTVVVGVYICICIYLGYNTAREGGLGPASTPAWRKALRALRILVMGLVWAVFIALFALPVMTPVHFGMRVHRAAFGPDDPCGCGCGAKGCEWPWNWDWAACCCCCGPYQRRRPRNPRPDDLEAQVAGADADVDAGATGAPVSMENTGDAVYMQTLDPRVDADSATRAPEAAHLQTRERWNLLE
ncbi:hypothetical protein AAE478_005745 [Parahypoxylon ruwenzoriense]